MPRMLLSCGPQTLPTLTVSQAIIGHVASNSEDVGCVFDGENHVSKENLAKVIAVRCINSEKDSLPYMLKALCKMAASE